MPEPIRFMSANLNLSTREEALAAIDASRERPVRIATVNPEFILESDRNPTFQKALAKMTHSVVDGSGLFFALRIWNRLPAYKVQLYHGSDLVGDLFNRYKDGSRSFFLLGGPEGQAQRAAEAISQLYPSIRIVGATSGGKIDTKAVNIDPELEGRILETKPDIVLVGFGAPKQELWIQAASNLPIPTMIGIGGTLGFYTDKKRAPGWLKIIHMEWLYRSLTEPGHWKRAYRAALVFPLAALFWIGKNRLSPGNVPK